MRGQPGDLIIERLGVPGGVTGPRHRGNRHPVGRTAHPRRLSLDEHLHRAGIQRPPPAPSLTLVVTTATPTTTPTPTTGTSSQPTRHDDHLEVFVELDALHHHLMVNTAHPPPHPLRLPPLLRARPPAVDSRKAKPDNGVHPRMVSYPPTERDGEPQFCRDVKAARGDEHVGVAAHVTIGGLETGRRTRTSCAMMDPASTQRRRAPGHGS